jgi:hypothetical protein
MPDPREEEIKRLRAALVRVGRILQIPAAEYVPAIRDAWAVIDEALAPAFTTPSASFLTGEGA